MCCLFQISLLENKAQDNWVIFFFFLSFVLSFPQLNLGVLFLPQIKGRILEREMAEQSKEAAYLRHKYGISCTVFKGVFEVLGLRH